MLDIIIASFDIGLLAVMFVGYWTYADYYTKLALDVRRVYWTLHAFMYGFCAMGFLVLADKEDGFDRAVQSSILIISLVSQWFFGVALIILLVAGFIKSREYFGRKRNKL